MRLKNYLTLEEQRYVYISEYFQHVMESFNKPSKVKVTRNGRSLFEATFSIDDKKYTFMARIIDRLAIVIFYPVDRELDLFKERKDKMYVGRVFASIFSSIEELLKHNEHINEIGFVAEYDALERLYVLMEPYILKRFPEWKVGSKEINNTGKLQYIYNKIER